MYMHMHSLEHSRQLPRWNPDVLHHIFGLCQAAGDFGTLHAGMLVCRAWSCVAAQYLYADPARVLATFIHRTDPDLFPGLPSPWGHFDAGLNSQLWRHSHNRARLLGQLVSSILDGSHLPFHDYVGHLRSFDFRWLLARPGCDQDGNEDEDQDEPGCHPVHFASYRTDTQDKWLRHRALERLPAQVRSLASLPSLFDEPIPSLLPRFSHQLRQLEILVADRAVLELLQVSGAFPQLTELRLDLRPLSEDGLPERPRAWRQDRNDLEDTDGRSRLQQPVSALVSGVVMNHRGLARFKLDSLGSGLLDVVHALRFLENLTHLGLYNCDMTRARLGRLALDYGDGSDSRNSDGGPGVGVALVGLEIADCRGCYDDDLVPILRRSVQTLEYLSLKFTQCTDAVLDEMLDGVGVLVDDGNTANGPAATHSSTCAQVHPDNEALNSIQICSRTDCALMPLRTLKLHGAFQTTLRSSTLRRLGRLCGRLKELDLFDTTFEVAGIHDLLELRGAQLTHLRLINGIDGTTLDDNTLAVVARSGRRLRHLDLSFAQLTGAGIDAFARTVAAAHAEAQAQDPQHSIAGDRPGRYSLEFVRLVHCGGLQSSHIRSLVKDMPTMKTLDLRRCSVVGHDEEQRVVQIAREDGTIASVIVGE